MAGIEAERNGVFHGHFVKVEQGGGVLGRPFLFSYGGYMKKKKVAIVGFAPDSRGEVANCYGDDFEVWGLNELMLEPDMQSIMLGNRCDRWFQLHWPISTVRHPDHVKHLAMLKCPVYLCHPHKDIPNGVEYPLDAVLKYFDIFGEGMAPDIVEQRDRAYFTNSISYMLALAIMEGFEEIHLFGVNMAQSQEYAVQRPSCEFFLGWARGRNIKIYLPTVSDLLMSPYLYGYDQGNRYVQKLEKRITELEQRHAAIRNDRINFQNQAAAALNAEHSMAGAKENCEYLYGIAPGNVRGPE